MESKVEIKRVVLKVNDKEISLSIQEAKELKKLLGDLFGETVKVETVKVIEHHNYPTWWPYTVPVYKNPDYICSWDVTCDGKSGTALYSAISQ